MDNKIIIFDMDGVLFDTIPFAQKTFLERHPGMSEDMYKEIHSGNFHEEAKKYGHYKKPETEDEHAVHRASYSESKAKTPLFQGIKDFLKKLHQSGYIIVINTNAWERNCLSLLENAGIKDFFDLIAAAELSKSKVEKFKIIESKYGVGKEKLLFITDALGDILEAEEAGVATLAVTWGVHNRSFFERKKHSNLIGVVDTMEELSNLITKFYAQRTKVHRHTFTR